MTAHYLAGKRASLADIFAKLCFSYITSTLRLGFCLRRRWQGSFNKQNVNFGMR